MKKLLDYFTKDEILLWLGSVFFIVISFLAFDRTNYMTLAASLIGVTSLIFNAKGNPFGQILMIVFSILYGIISYSFSYYGEMITYLGMTAPMALFALISWLKNPYKGKRSEVEISSVSKTDVLYITASTAIVTVVFFFILKALNTQNLIFSTVSVSTSFAAAYLTAKRSPYFAIAYAANDIVLIILWILAAIKSISYISVIICFVAFLINDLYGYINWKRLQEKQNSEL